MTSYFISVIEEGSTWRIGSEEFISELKSKWPEATVSKTHEMVWFKMEPGPGHGYVYAHLSSSGDAVVVEMVDDFRDIVTLAIWFRSLVPTKISMMLFDESYTERFDLPPTMTEEELAKVFLAD